MPVTSVSKDADALTMTVVADFTVPVERLWDAYADPRQIEKFWGPVEWPATFVRHDFVPGGRSDYYMTGPDGERSGGSWFYISVDPHRSFVIEDGFAHDDGAINDEMPNMRMTFTFETTDAGSRVTILTKFESLDDMEQLIGMGMLEGMHSAMSQMDGIISDLRSFAAGRSTETQILSETQVRISRIVRGAPQQVWAAHHDADLLKRWLLGPDGWTMPVCVVGIAPGDAYRYEWAPDGGGAGFGFEGEVLESVPPVRAVTTERMVGTDGPTTTNELTFTPLDDGTLLSLVITYPSADVRDAILATGMTDGMETSYARLEDVLAS